jgi:phage terminase large subunit-like protein
VAKAQVFAHRVDRYAVDVGAGRIVAGPMVRLACSRHLQDRSRAASGAIAFVFDEAAADHAIAFFETVLRLPDTLDDNGDPIPFLLTPANTFIVGSLFGWKTADGWRRYREAYIEMGKGNAKTPLAAGIGLYGLTMDGEQAAEIYSAATGMEQAKLCWIDAQRMVDASPELAAIIHQSQNNLAYEPTMSFFRPVSSEKRGKSGPRPHMALIDELHEAADGVIVNKLRAGAKRRKQPLFVEITNSGFDRTSICWQHHEHSRKILEGLVDDTRWFGYVCGLDEGDDPLTDRRCHAKANPNLGVVIQQEYLDRQVANAKNIPAETNTVLRLNFCVWTQAHAAFFDRGKWDGCKVASESELLGAPCYGGLDLGQSDDFTAWVRIWLLDDGRIGVRCRFWVPRAALLKYPERPYEQWEKAGLLTVTDGDTTDMDLVEQTVADDCRSSGVLELSYDKRFAAQLALHLTGAGILCIDTPQGFYLNEAIRKLHEWVVTGLLCHNGNAILGWMADNAVVIVGRNQELRIDKMRAKEKIDGIAALAMAASRAILRSIDESVYLTRGVMSLEDYLT